MSDVNKVKSNAGILYGLEDTEARTQINELRGIINSFDPDLDISDLIITSSSRTGYSTIRFSDGTHIKTVDVLTASLDPSDQTVLENLVRQYIGDISGNYEVTNETLIIKSVSIDDEEGYDPGSGSGTGDPVADPTL